MRFDLRILVQFTFIAALVVVFIPHDAAAQQGDRSGCERRAERMSMKGGMKNTFIRECMAGAKLDTRKHKTFKSAATARGNKDTRCLGASNLGKCER